jgi:diguanylate cyclase
MPDGFFLGALFAAALLVVGLAVGVAIGRSWLRSATSRRTSAELQPVLSQLWQFTNSFSQDVSEYRSLIEVAALRAQQLTHDASEATENGSTPVVLLSQIIEANEHLRRRLDEAGASLRCQTEELNCYMTEARTDALTHLPNRRAFDDELSRRLSQYRRQGTPFGVLLIDVDRFKLVNDTYGHHIGDQVLKGVAEALRTTVRDCDLVARYGGEEFAMLLSGNTCDEFMQAAERVRRAVEQREVACDSGKLQATVSCGVAEIQSGEDAGSLVRRADEALYASKSDGRNCAHWHDGRRMVRVTLAEGSNEPAFLSPPSRPAAENFREVCAELRKKLLEIAK